MEATTSGNLNAANNAVCSIPNVAQEIEILGDDDTHSSHQSASSPAATQLAFDCLEQLDDEQILRGDFAGALERERDRVVRFLLLIVLRLHFRFVSAGLFV